MVLSTTEMCKSSFLHSLHLEGGGEGECVYNSPNVLPFTLGEEEVLEEHHGDIHPF